MLTVCVYCALLTISVCVFFSLLSYGGRTFDASVQTPFAKMHHDFDLEKRTVYLGYMIFAKVNNQRKLILALHLSTDLVF